MVINVVCLKWGTKYGPEYVNNLYSGVERNATIPFKFHCFTEDSTGLNSSVVVHGLPFADNAIMKGWWQKVWLFSPEMPIRGKVLYIDLDTLITGNIDDILRVDGFVVLRDFYASMAKGVSTTDIGSGLMSWDSREDYSEIWEKFIVNPSSAIRSLRPHGDQRWIQRFVNSRKYWQDELGDQVISFKCHCVEGLPDNARIVCYHGKPSIPESMIRQSLGWKSRRIPKSEWVGEYWCG